MTNFISHFEQVESAAEWLARSWPGGPPVRVVDSPKDLPMPAPADTKGVFTRDGVYMVAATQDHIGVRRTMAHEVLGHHGFRKALGAAWPSFMVDVLAGARNGDASLNRARHQVQRVYVDTNGECTLTALHQADEVVAAVVEQKLNLATGRIKVEKPARKLASAALGRVAREWLCLDRPVTSDELDGHILAVEHRIRHGGPLFGLGGKFFGWYAPRMSEKFPGPKRPATSLEESQRLYELADSMYFLEWVASFLASLAKFAKGAFFLILPFALVYFSWLLSKPLGCTVAIWVFVWYCIKDE